MRLYAATDHLYEIQVPKTLSKTLRERIFRWRDECFHHRMDTFTDSIVTDKSFKEGEEIIIEIDKEVFKIQKIVTRYR